MLFESLNREFVISILAIYAGNFTYNLNTLHIEWSEERNIVLVVRFCKSFIAFRYTVL